MTPLERLASEPEELRRRKGTLHTPGEILQQPWLWRDTAGRVAAVRDRAEALFKGADFAVITGAGSSLHAARIIDEAARRRFGPAVSSVSCTDLMLDPDAYLPRGRRGVLLSLSRSGESPEAVEAARIAAERFPDLSHIAVTCNAQGRLAKLVAAHPRGLCLTLHEKSYDQGLGTTSSMTGTIVAGRLLVEPTTRVESLASAAEALLGGGDAEAVASLDPERVVVLGTGPLEAAAQEVAHKVMELTDGQVPTLARSYLEFRHGPIAFINPRTLLVCLVSPDRHVQRYERDFIRQATSGGAALKILAAGAGNPEVLSTEAQGVVPFASGNPGEAAILSVVFGQMLALFISIRRGLTPDRPGNRGLVNPVVQGVTIHPRGGAP